MSNEFLFIILGFLLGILIYKIVNTIFLSKVEEIVEIPQSTEENDYIKWLMECRHATIRMAVHCLQSAWFINPDLIEQLSIAQTDLNNMIAVLPYENYLFRWYFDWKHNIMVLGFTTNDHDEHFIERKTFFIKGGCLNFERVYMYCVKLQKKYLKEPENKLLNLDETGLQMLLEKIAAEEKDIPASVKEFWTQWKAAIFEEGATKEDIAKFIYFTLAIKNNKEEEVSE